MKQPAPLVEPEGLAGAIDALLPQTQCTKCGYDGCAPYAVAIAEGSAGIDRCPPGGDATIAALAALLRRAVVPLDRSRGEHGPRRIARIVEPLCIGCTLCIQACPVDAIVGAPKRLHAVIADRCTGCDLCVAPCPVDCIEMRDADDAGRPWPQWSATDASAGREHARSRTRRLLRLAAAGRAAPTRVDPVSPARAEPVAASRAGVRIDDATERRAAVERAMALARSRLERRPRR